MRIQRRSLLGGMATTAAGALAGCFTLDAGPPAAQDDRTVVPVGSKTFPEQRILGYMTYEALNARTDLITVDRMDYGEAPALWNGVLDGSIGTYWEYTGTVWELLLPRRRRKVHGPERLYREVATEIEEAGAVYLNRAPIDNSWALAVRSAWAERTGVETISDLAAYAKRDDTEFRAAIGEDFATRADGWVRLLDYYGFGDGAISRRPGGDDLEVVSVGLTYERLAAEAVDVAMAFATDPQIDDLNLELLADDRSFFVPYDPAPIVAGDLVADRPEVRDVLNPIGPAIGDLETMRQLNARAVLGDERPRSIARDFLESEGLV